MTEELALIIKNATCKKCNGEGLLAWRVANERFAGATYHVLTKRDPM